MVSCIFLRGLGSVWPNHHDGLQDGAFDRLMNSHWGGPPNSQGEGLVRFQCDQPDLLVLENLG